LEENIPKKIVINGDEIMVIKIGEDILALSARCTHRGCDLTNGQVKGHEIICRCHGARFNLLTGESNTPNITSKPLKTYEVEVSGDKIYIIST